MLRTLSALAICGVAGLAAQTEPPANEPQMVIVALAPATYPPMALAARVYGGVELTVVLHRDGTVNSVSAVSGPPMLQKSALEDAQNNQYQCQGCSEPLTSFHLQYSFVLGPTVGCDGPDKSYPRMTRSGDTITLAAQPIGKCDPAETIDRIRARSIKCAFLWKCGWREID